MGAEALLQGADSPQQDFPSSGSAHAFLTPQRWPRVGLLGSALVSPPARGVLSTQGIKCNFGWHTWAPRPPGCSLLLRPAAPHPNPPSSLGSSTAWKGVPVSTLTFTGWVTLSDLTSVNSHFLIYNNRDDTTAQALSFTVK